MFGGGVGGGGWGIRLFLEPGICIYYELNTLRHFLFLSKQSHQVETVCAVAFIHIGTAIFPVRYLWLEEIGMFSDIYSYLHSNPPFPCPLAIGALENA